MKHITQTLKDKYYRYQPGEFLPVYDGGRMINRREFHAYRIKWLIEHRDAALYLFTHSSSVQ